MAILRLCLGERNVRNLNLQNVTAVFDPPENLKESYKFGPLRIGTEYLFLGEIKNMPGHGIFVDYKSGQTLFGPHIVNFYVSMEGIKIIEGKTECDTVQYTVQEQEYLVEENDDQTPHDNFWIDEEK